MIKILIEHRTKDKEETRELVKVIELVHTEARKQHGFVRGETFVDITDPCHVVVLSSWQTLEDSNAWDESQALKSLSPLIEKHLAERRTTIKMTENVIWKRD